MDNSSAIYGFLQSCHHIDKDVTLAINSLNSQFTDAIWQVFSNKEIWFILYFAVFIFLIRNLGWKKALVLTASIALTIVCCDQLGNVSKDYFERLRPCWDADMMAAGLHTLEGFGNKYGFYSAHAANAMGFAVCSLMAFRNDRSRNYDIYVWSILVWGFCVGISRVFVGKHFLGDVMVGFAVGILFGYFFGRLATLVLKRLKW